MDGMAVKIKFNENGSSEKKCVTNAMYQWAETIFPKILGSYGEIHTAGTIQDEDKWHLCFFVNEGENIPKNVLEKMSTFCQDLNVSGWLVEVSDDRD